MKDKIEALSQCRRDLEQCRQHRSETQRLYTQLHQQYAQLSEQYRIVAAASLRFSAQLVATRAENRALQMQLLVVTEEE